MKMKLLQLLTMLFLASCAHSDKNSEEAFFSKLSGSLSSKGVLSPDGKKLIEAFEQHRPLLVDWEKDELTQHINACQAPRYTIEEQIHNIERVLTYKYHLKDYYLRRKDSLQRLHLKPIFNRLCDENYWDSAFVEECFWGTSDYMIVLLPQVHEVNNTKEELSIVQPVQRNISNIQAKLYSEGANAFLYEGIPFKEISREIPTKIPLDTIAKYFSKKSEINFETENPEVLSYGIESKKVHQTADSIRSYYWTLETFYKAHSEKFPLEVKLFRQSMTAHVDSCLSTSDMNLKNLNKSYFDSLVYPRFHFSPKISKEDFLCVKDKIFYELLEVMLNERNRTFVDNTVNLQKITGERFLVLKAGTSHFDEVDRLKDYENFSLMTVQKILKQRQISYIYLVPYYVWHYNL